MPLNTNKYKSRLSEIEHTYVHCSSDYTQEILGMYLTNKVCGPALREKLSQAQV